MRGVPYQNDREITGSIQKKFDKWYVVLNLYDISGKRKPKWISTGLPVKGNMRKAEKMLGEEIASYMERAVSRSVKNNMVADFALSWLESIKGSIENSTWENYENVTINHIIPYFKQKKLALDEVKPKHIRDYYTFKSTGGRLDGKKGGLAYPTLQKHASVISLIFQDALILEEINRNPALSVKLPQRVEDKQEDFKNIKFLNAAEANHLLSLYQNEVIQPLIFMCLYYGLRRSEVLGLKWDSIDFESNSMRIQHTVVKHKTIEEKSRTKTKSSRGTYDLLPEVRQLLLQTQKQQENYKKLYGKKYVKTDYVFTWPDGRMIRPDYVTHRFQKVLENNGMEHMRFHDLRHSCASILYDKGWNVKDIQEWLRHSKLEVTMNIYTHISEKRKKILTKDLQNTFTLDGLQPAM